MTLRGRLSMLFPLTHLALSAAGPVQAIRTGNPWWLIAGMAVLYLVPPVCFRIHQLFSPLREGRSNLSEPVYSPWWSSLQFQAVFNAVPELEALLRMIPGLYSAWLRLWGSKVGRNVNWTLRVEITDRPLLDIGTNTILGHRTAVYPHVVDKRKNGDLLLYVKRISIGEGAFIDTGSRLGPGASIPAGARLPALTDVGINETWEAK